MSTNIFDLETRQSMEVMYRANHYRDVAADLLAALKVGLHYTMTSALQSRELARWKDHAGMHGIAEEHRKDAKEAEHATAMIRAAIDKATQGV